MDDADRAKEREMAHRDRALANELAAHMESEPPLIIDGRRCCIDCEEPIPEERLAARPDSVRCIECKQIKEQKQRGYR